MGAIVSDLLVPDADADPNLRIRWRKANDWLNDNGFAGFTTQEILTVTKAEFITRLKRELGVAVASELTTDPESRGYSGASDAEASALISNPYAGRPRRIDKTNEQGYRTLAGSSDVALVAEHWQGGATDFIADLISDGVINRQAYVTFRETTTTTELRGTTVKVQSAKFANTLGLGSPLPVSAPAGERFDLLNPNGDQIVPRISLALRGFPYSPNVLSAGDITGARS